MLKEYDMKRDSVEINHDAPQWSHNAVWNRRYMEPKTGYTLRQLWADSEPAIGQKSSPSYDIKEGDILRAVAAITNLPSSTLPDSPFFRALGTPAAQNVKISDICGEMNPLVFSALEEVNLVFILMMSSTVMVDIVFARFMFYTFYWR